MKIKNFQKPFAKAYQTLFVSHLMDLYNIVEHGSFDVSNPHGA